MKLRGARSFHLARVGVGPLMRWLALHAHGPGPGMKLGGGCTWRSRVPPVDVSGGTNQQGGGSSTRFAWVGVGVGLQMRKLDHAQAADALA